MDAECAERWSKKKEPLLAELVSYGDAREFAQVALRHGVVIVPGPNMSADEQRTRRVRLTFLSEPKALTAGVVRLSAAWRYYRSIKPRSREQTVMV